MVMTADIGGILTIIILIVYCCDDSSLLYKHFEFYFAVAVLEENGTIKMKVCMQLHTYTYTVAIMMNIITSVLIISTRLCMFVSRP